jgi:hypothetical protein
LQHALATFEEERERKVQPKKPTPGLATPDLMMSQVEVERHGGVGFDSSHELLVGDCGVGSTSTRRDRD